MNPAAKDRHDVLKERLAALLRSNRVALITGASRGIGRGIALELAKLGHDLVINYAVNEVAARQTAADCLSAALGNGKEIRPYICQADLATRKGFSSSITFSSQVEGTNPKGDSSSTNASFRLGVGAVGIGLERSSDEAHGATHRLDGGARVKSRDRGTGDCPKPQGCGTVGCHGRSGSC